MPWDTRRDDRCPADRPWAVIKQTDGSLEGCHPNENRAKRQQAALYANEAEMTEPESKRGRVWRIEIEYQSAGEIWPDENLELQAGEDGNGLHFSGYAAVFDVPSNPRPPNGHTLYIRKGAFAKTIKDGRAKKMFLNHNDNIVLASTSRDTLRLTEDDRGLKVDADLPDNEWGRPVADAIRRGDIESMSFGYIVPPNRDRWNEDRTERQILETRLYEVSPITAWPGFNQTSVSVESLLTTQHQLSRILGILGSADGELDDEQLAFLNDSIARHRRGPTPEEIRAEWAERFALS